MSKNKLINISVFVILFSFAAFSGFILYENNNSPGADVQNSNNKISVKPTSTPTKIPLKSLPVRKTLTGGTHNFQTFNNCGPSSLSMALSYFDIFVTQHELGLSLRPFQNAAGDNDDKSVTLAELVEKSKEYGFIPYHRPNGNIELLKNFINYDIPIITRTWTKPNEDIGHFRVVKGYDEQTQTLVQDDSLQGKDLDYSYEDFNTLWEKFGYEYLVLVPEGKIEIAKSILGENHDYSTAWKNAAGFYENTLIQTPGNIYTRFNLSVAYYNIGEFQKSVAEFEKIEDKLPFCTLWYQFEPIIAYQKLGDYQRVFDITNTVLNNHNRAFTELYIIRGQIYKDQGNLSAAKSEFEKAVYYNKNNKEAQSLFNSI